MEHEETCKNVPKRVDKIRQVYEGAFQVFSGFKTYEN